MNHSSSNQQQRNGSRNGGNRRHQSNSRHTGDSNAQSRRRTGEHKVDPKWVGLVIGRGGETVQRLAREAGNGCRINHDRENKGRFTLTAWDSSAITRAKMAIDKLIQDYQQPKMTKTETTKTKTKTKTTQKREGGTRTLASFSALASDSEEEEEQGQEDEHKTTEQLSKRSAKQRKLAAKKSKDLSHLINFNQGENDRIKTMKHEHWLQGKAYRDQLGKEEKQWEALSASERAKYGTGKRGWEYYKYQKMGEWNRDQDKQKHQAALLAAAPKPKTQASYQHDQTWAALGKGEGSSISLGVWGQAETMDGVRGEAPVAKPVDEAPQMEVIQSKPQEEEQTTEETVAPPAAQPKKKKFHSNNLNQLVSTRAAALQSKPALRRSFTVEQTGNDAWSDDEDCDCNCGDFSAAARKGPLMLPGMMTSVSDLGQFDGDLESWDADTSTYA